MGLLGSVRIAHVSRHVATDLQCGGTTVSVSSRQFGREYGEDSIGQAEGAHALCDGLARKLFLMRIYLAGDPYTIEYHMDYAAACHS